MPRDYISRPPTRLWDENYEKVFPRRKREEPTKDKEPQPSAEEQRAAVARAFPFCPLTREE